MKNQQGYRIVPFSINRQMVAASTSVGREQSNIHTITEVDIARPRQLMHEIRERTSRSPSLTAYITTCLARAVSEFPNFNAFRKGRNLVILDDVTISVLVEREINGEIIPENLGIKAAQTKTYWQIHEEIRGAQNHAGGGLGGLEGITWLRFIPGILFRTFVKIAAKNIGMMKRYGAIGVTAVGMFGLKNQALWAIPIVGGATVGVAVGGIVERPSIVDRHLESRDYLCLTITFNHDIVDGAPAARFVKRFSELLMSGELLENEKHLISTESEILAQET
jgi:pyruvate/2-oxoglutarate dehydrogenase complex dihydrolipoamide acyltransferase (E2) component